MKKKAIFILLMLFIIFNDASPGQEKSKGFPVLKGPYLGQIPPGKTPEIFAPGIVSTGMSESAIAVSSDGNEIFRRFQAIGFGCFDEAVK